MSTQEGITTPSVASTVPPEVLDNIFGWRFSKELPRKKQRNGKALALVCKAWCEPVRRHLFREVKLESIPLIKSLAKATDDSLFLRQYVQSLKLDGYDSGRARWTVRDLNALMKKFPNVTSLALHLNSNSPGYAGYFDDLQELPQITHLDLDSEEYDSELGAYRSIISSTPNLTSLIISNYGRHGGFMPSSPGTPINLPNLTLLHLGSPKLSACVFPARLLSQKALEHVTELGIVGTDYGFDFSGSGKEYSAADLIAKIGKNIKTLKLPDGFGDEHDRHLITSCPQVETLILSSPFSPLFLTPTITTVKIALRHENKTAGAWIISDKEPATDWKNLKRMEIDDTPISYEIKEAIVERGVELVINGVKYISGPPPEDDEDDEGEGEGDEDGDEEMDEEFYRQMLVYFMNRMNGVGGPLGGGEEDDDENIIVSDEEDYSDEESDEGDEDEEGEEEGAEDDVD